ncbi:MAG TPA: bifunctional enoyl-CoA hydratase/phosphate acetyltransferase [Burkholderiales bacterium]|nr:bifunctional enoyl-CoA hydratase/phosphate acetyltransferase [Burkholderiales bacterium]
MATASYRNVTFEEIEVGKGVTVSRAVTNTEVEALALVSGEVDPYHVEPAAFGQAGVPVAQGVGAEAIVSGLLNRRMPGPGTRILNQALAFEGEIRVGDEIVATVTPREKRSEGHIVVFECTVAAGGRRVASGTVTVEAPTRRIAYDEIATPQMILRHNDAIARLLKRCEGLEPVTCAIVHPCDRDSLLGPLEAAKRKLIVPILVGPEGKIRAVAAAEKVDVSAYRIVSTEHSHAAAERAVAMARAGEVEALMKGSLHTDELMGAVVPSATGLRTARRISHAFVLDVPAYPRPLMVTDAAINIFPDLEVKADIAQNAIELAQVLGVETPKVAILSAVETVNPKIQSTLDAAALCKMAERGQITGGILDGPLAFDNAISEEAAKTKKIISPVAGKADILLVPDLEAGNMVAKQLQYLAGADSAGIVLGTRVPIVLTSRSDSVRARVASCALAKLYAHFHADARR